MNLQFISDSTGETTGVYIPIKEWNELKDKFKGIEQEEMNILDWHKNLVLQRLADHADNPAEAVDFDQAMDDIEQML